MMKARLFTAALSAVLLATLFAAFAALGGGTVSAQADRFSSPSCASSGGGGADTIFFSHASPQNEWTVRWSETCTVGQTVSTDVQVQATSAPFGWSDLAQSDGTGTSDAAFTAQSSSGEFRTHIYSNLVSCSNNKNYRMIVYANANALNHPESTMALVGNC